MNGGILVQNCHNHALNFTHPISNDAGATYDITSTHHQMQYPFTISPKFYEILYSCSTRSDVYEGDGVNPEQICERGDVEIVEYHVPHKPRCLAIQGHPEMMPDNAPVIAMLNELIENSLNKIKK